jgi:putative transposase
MIKSIKVMLLPNKKQAKKLAETANAARYAYNWTLGKQREYFEANKKYMPDSEIRKLFTAHKQDNAWLYNISNNAAKQAIKDCCNAFIRFLSEKKKKGYIAYGKKQIAKSIQKGYKLTRYDMAWHPKFKKKGKAELKFYADTEKTNFSDTHVKLESIAESKRTNRAKANWIKLAEEARIPTNVKYTNPRVKFDGIRWWVSVGIESEPNTVDLSPEGIGIDVGVKDLAVLSDEERTKYKNINKTAKVRKLKKKQRRLQRKISRKYEINKKGESYRKTGNIIKSEKQLLKINQRLTGIRHNHVNYATSEIIRQKPRFIVLEDLNVRGMMKNKHLSKAVQEQCLYEFSRQIEYKCNWSGIKFIEADRYYPSSKLCSVCGNIKSDLKLSDRIYKCECGNEIDRDYQAALNLKKYGELLA